ncbi:MAG: hypothetical protein Q8L10_02055 [Candidatus Moranbacteria bacterium]|nr:hypothetical protein [Candidatus Moranbacteria bacterium]
MKKTFWWRIGVIFIGIIIFGWDYLVVNSLEFDLCQRMDENCLFKYNSYIDSSMFFSLFILIVSPFLFFISDKVFLKWLQFAGIWILLSIIAIAATPDRHNFLSLSPDRETVSIWMGSLFVIISLVKISWDSRKQKR